MRHFVAAVFAISVATPITAGELSPSDNRDLLQLAQAMDQAWTAGDADANAQLFAADATARFGGDPLGQGRDAIRSQFDSFFMNRPAGLRHVTSIERVEQLGSSLAMWDAVVRVERQQPGGQWATLTQIRNLTVVIRQPEGWRIKAVRAFPVAQ